MVITKPAKWITPTIKQSFVTLGVSLQFAAQGLVMGYAAILLPQLKQPDSIIPIDDSSGSWIASIMGFALAAGNLLVPYVMEKFGRKIANVISLAPVFIGWILIITSHTISQLLFGRFLQGITMGMSSSLGPVLIGEYTSPRNRGAFLTTLGLSLGSGVLTAHTLGSYLSWQTTGIVCGVIVLVNLMIIIYSPESPSWLANQGRYEECEKVFRWLRGDTEDEELQKIIEKSKEALKGNDSKGKSFQERFKETFDHLGVMFKKREFYIPMIVMIHIHTLGQWAGSNILASYAGDIFQQVIGNNANTALMIITLDTQRIISNTCALIVIRKIRRRTMLFATVGINISTFLAIAGYTYVKTNNLLPYDHPYIGVALIHLLMFSIATGTIPLPFIIAGELFPLQYRSLMGGVSSLFHSLNLFVNVKTMPYLFNAIGFYGTFTLYACIVGYCLLVAGSLLPETKDRTLQDIEEQLKGRPLTSSNYVTAL